MSSFEHEVEVGVSASALWAALMDQNTLFPKLLPEAIRSIEVLEGDGLPGSIRKISFGPVAHNGGSVKERMVSLDIEGRVAVTEEMEGGHMAQFGFSKWVQTIKVVSTGDESSKLLFKVEYEGGSEIDQAIAETKYGISTTFKTLEGHIKGSA